MKRPAVFRVMAIACMAIVFIGFAPTFYLAPAFRAPALTTVLWVHGLAFSAWMVVFLAQVLLVGRDRVQWHRRLGAASVVLVGAVAVLGPAVALHAARRDFAAGDAGALAFLTTPLMDIVGFVALAGLGLALRRRPAAHKRLMLLATFSMLHAAFARWPFAVVAGHYFLAVDVLVGGVAAWELATTRKLHPALSWGGLALVASQPLRVALADTSVWRTVALALVGAT